MAATNRLSGSSCSRNCKNELRARLISPTSSFPCRAARPAFDFSQFVDEVAQLLREARLPASRRSCGDLKGDGVEPGVISFGVGSHQRLYVIWRTGCSMRCAANEARLIETLCCFWSVFVSGRVLCVYVGARCRAGGADDGACAGCCGCAG